MDLHYTGEQELMRDSTRRMVERVILPELKAHDRDQPLPKPAFIRIFRALADLGLTTARLPADDGGSGLTMLDYGIMFEELPPAISMCLISQDACIARLYTECNAEQRERFLPALVKGEALGCTGSTEPDTGSDPRGVKTRLTEKDGRLVLNGRKMWITNVSLCDYMIVTCLDCREGEPGKRVVKVVVERAVSPFEAREIDTIGLRQGLLGEAVFDNCIVPPENLIDASGGGTAVLKSTWAVNRPLIGLQAVHLAQRAYDMALDYAKSRRQFDDVIGGHQLVQKNLSDMMTAITTSRLLCYHALAVIDSGAEPAGASAMAKRYSQNACREAVWQAMNVLGAMGLSTEAGVEALYRDMRMLAIPDGTNEILALIQGRELTGLDAFRRLRTRG
jgi:alkylation response protein AidB-like acyl-CoA dehydrogenase